MKLEKIIGIVSILIIAFIIMIACLDSARISYVVSCLGLIIICIYLYVN